MSKKNVAELLVETLARAGVERIYGVPGDSLNGITDSIRRREQPRWIHVRHEETAAFAAGAEAHLTGRLAVCAGSCGPGNLHLINGLYDCHRNRVPVLAIAAQVPTHEIGSGYFQETHPEHLFAQCSHYCELVSHPEQMPRVLEIAIQTAVSRRGVSVVILPGDVALHDAVGGRPRLTFPEPTPLVCPSDEEIAELAKLLNGARRVTIFGGAGCAGAHAELMEVARRLNAPVVHSLRGKEFIEYENPFDVGLTGLLGFSSGYHAMMACEVLLMIGSDFPYQQFFPQDATIVQIDVRGEQLGRRTKVDLGLVGDAKTTLRALLPKLTQHEDDRHLKAAREHYAKTRKGLDERSTLTPAAEAAREDRRVSERRAGVRGAGNEGDGVRRLRNGPRQPRFREDGRGRWAPGADRGEAGTGSADDRPGIRARRTRAGRGARAPEGARHASDDQPRPGDRVRHLHDQGGSQRPRRRDRRPGQDEPLALAGVGSLRAVLNIEDTISHCERPAPWGHQRESARRYPCVWDGAP